MDGAALPWQAFLAQRGPSLAAALAVFLGFWVAAVLARRALRRLAAAARPGRAHLLRLLGRAAWALLVLVGLVSALGTLGVDVAAMVAGLGLGGFALGLALKDILSNALSGVLILLYEPFVPGDRVRLAGNEGEVEAIDLRYTVLRTPEGRVLVPNASVFTSSLTVLGKGGGA